MIELFLPTGEGERVKESLEKAEVSVQGIWMEELAEQKMLVRVLVSAGETEDVLDMIEKQFAWLKDFRIVLLPVEATLPREDGAERKRPNRLSRAELYHDVEGSARADRVFIIMVVLSSVIATIGLMRDNVAIVIAAMVVAPLLGPNVALAMATTLGDGPLMRKAAFTSAVGLAIALLMSALTGALVTFNPAVTEIASRTHTGLADIALAFAAGCAGALTLTTGERASIVGVMVAVALLPPTVTFGMLLGAGHFTGAVGALELVLANLVCLNLAGVLTFLARGVRPNKWWQEKAARRATAIAVSVWLSMLVALILMIVV